MAMLVIAAIAGSGSAASSLTVDEVLAGGYEGKNVQVTGTVVVDSIANEGAAVTFYIEAEEGADGNAESDAAGSEGSTSTSSAENNGASDGTEESPRKDDQLRVTYEGALPATFGAGVVAICTGTVEDGQLNATEMVTKCPSKYESAEGSLTVKGLLDQKDSMVGESTKVCGYVRGQIASADADVRFTIESQGETLDVAYDGGLPEGIEEGTALVIEGSLGEDGVFRASAQPAVDASVSE